MQEHSPRRFEATPVQQRLELVMDWGALGMWEVDLRNGKTVWSVGSEQMLGTLPGQSPSDLQELLSFIDPEDLPRAQENLARAFHEKLAKVTDELRILRRDGQTRNLTVFVHFLFDERGEPERMIGLAQDITETREREREHLAAEERLRIIHATSKAWTWQVDTADWIVHRPLEYEGAASPRFGPNQTLYDWFERVHPEDRTRVKSGLLKAIESGELWQDELRVQWPNGEYRWIYDRAQRIDRPGRTPLIAGAAIDITERKTVEQHLVENEERLRSAYIAGKMWPWEVEASSLVVQRSLDSGRYRGPVRPVSLDLAGFLDTIHPEERDIVRSSIENSIKTHCPYSCEYRIRWNDGTYHWIASRGGMVQNDRGIWKLMGVALDLEEQKRTQLALEESERLRLLAVDAANMGTFTQEMSTGIIQWSDRQKELFGVGGKPFSGKREDFRKLVLPEDLKRIDAESATLAVARARRFRYEFRIRRANDGAIRWIAAVGEYTYAEDGSLLRTVGVNYDVTEAKQKENALRESEAFRRLAMGAAQMGAWEWDYASRRLRWSEEQEVLFGFVPGTFDGRLDTFLSRVHPEDLPSLQEYEARLLRSADTRYETEFRILLPDGTERWIGALGEVDHDDDGRAIRIFGVNFDLTTRKQTEAALRTGEKLATAGKMAASLAHEINNPLAAVTNLLYLIGQDEALSDGSKRFVSMASAEVSRVSHITRNMLAFYRETTAPVEVDLAELVQSVLELYAPKIREFRVKVDVQTGDRCRVLAFPGELRQVVSNLVVNAIEAMQQGGSMRIRVQARREWKTERSGVRFVVADSGVGISREAQVRLFEPFFTTKGEKGTGLGLWVSRDIINKHQGTIRVRSSQREGRQGTCFSLFLPAETTTSALSTNREKTSSTAG